MYQSRILFILAVFNLVAIHSFGQYSRQDSLRGSVNSARNWWDVEKYEIWIEPNYPEKTLKGTVAIHFRRTGTAADSLMQIDLQVPMVLDSVHYFPATETGKKLPARLSFLREGNVYWINTKQLIKQPATAKETVLLYYHGKPREAINPPWDGGWIWTKDERGRPWMTVACQGLGASVWYPCKDYQGDEPDSGASLTITAPDSLVAVGNGRLVAKTKNRNNTTNWVWQVKNPINNYNIIPYIGKYVSWQESFAGALGNLDCSFWVLDYDLSKAKKQFARDTKPMLSCFEDWFGPYPFYEDGYKLVQAPHLGMEHQSAVAYGNKFRNGYLGTDLSGTGWGATWDFIIVHESGHEWFANSISTRDIADMWVHESFTSYSEVLFVECRHGKKAAYEYCRGTRNNIHHDRPIIGDYGVNNRGSGDMYPKGANMLHSIRQVINNDSLFKSVLRGLNQEFFHKIVSTREIEQYISRHTGQDFSLIFDQYLRTTKIPELQYRLKGSTFSYRWANCIRGFNMPIQVCFGTQDTWIKPEEEWQDLTLSDAQKGKPFSINPNFYITRKNLTR